MATMLVPKGFYAASHSVPCGEIFHYGTSFDNGGVREGFIKAVGDSE